MYEQRVDMDIAARKPGSSSHLSRDPLLSMLPWRDIASVGPCNGGHGIKLRLRHMLHDETEDVEYDALIVGTGYDRQLWRTIAFTPGANSLYDAFGRGLDRKSVV